MPAEVGKKIIFQRNVPVREEPAEYGYEPLAN
jgi:hypothetical protein